MSCCVLHGRNIALERHKTGVEEEDKREVRGETHHVRSS